MHAEEPVTNPVFSNEYSMNGVIRAVNVIILDSLYSFEYEQMLYHGCEDLGNFVVTTIFLAIWFGSKKKNYVECSTTSGKIA